MDPLPGSRAEWINSSPASEYQMLTSGTQQQLLQQLLIACLDYRVTLKNQRLVFILNAEQDTGPIKCGQAYASVFSRCEKLK